MGLARRDQGARRSRCPCASATTSNAELTRNPHAPCGFRRRTGICGVAAPRQCAPALPASRRLASAGAALGTRPMLLLGQAPGLPYTRPRQEGSMLHVRSAALCALAIGPCLALAQAQGRQPATPYFPPPHQWERRMASAVGFDAALLDEAVTFATSSETPRFKDLLLDQATTFGAREPFDTPIGPMKERGPVSGLIIPNGHLVAQWGDPDRVDMTHSVTKTFLSTVASLAFQRGLINDVNDRARPYMPPGVDLFDAPHNHSNTWDHLLRQTSDWQG